MYKTKSYRGGVLAAAVAAVTLVSAAQAASVSNAYADYGHATNNTGGFCAATSIANSLQFLANENPGVYGSTGLIDGNASTTRDDIVAIESQETITPSTGPAYQAPTDNETIWNSMVDYIGAKAPDTTSFAAQFDPGSFSATGGYAYATDIQNTIPTLTFLYDQLAAGAGVEIGFIGQAPLNVDGSLDYNNQTAHMVTLTGVNSTTGAMTYLDPNAPSSLIDTLLTVDGNGYLSFYWNNGGNPGEQVAINEVWAESAITPIPSALSLSALGILGLGGLALARRKYLRPSQLF